MSKASEWAKRRNAVDAQARKLDRAVKDLPAFRLSQRERDRTKSLYAYPLNYPEGPRLMIGADDLRLSPKDALALAAWIIDTFGEQQR